MNNTSAHYAGAAGLLTPLIVLIGTQYADPNWVHQCVTSSSVSFGIAAVVSIITGPAAWLAARAGVKK